MHRSKAAQMATRDRELFQHIRKMRADPTRQVMHNPLPDYYVRTISMLTVRVRRLDPCINIASGFATKYVC